MTTFSFFIGVDQTGATDSKGNPKSLPAAVIYKNGLHWRLVFSEDRERLEIPRLTKEHLHCFLRGFPVPGRDLSKVALVLDSVFGLPEKTWPQQQKTKKGGSEGLFALFQNAAKFEHGKKSFGRDAAEAFFGQFLPKTVDGVLPQRLCEKKSGANSVFLTRPYQRNIGCGSYRIWKDLGSANEKWFQIWGFDEPEPHVQEGPWIFEAYPTLFWKQQLHIPVRNALSLCRWLKTSAPEDLTFSHQSLELLKEDPDLCDSVVLALGAWMLQRQDEIWQTPSFPALQKEGWILGLPL